MGTQSRGASVSISSSYFQTSMSVSLTRQEYGNVFLETTLDVIIVNLPFITTQEKIKNKWNIALHLVFFFFLGFGHQTPKTTLGQLMVIFYAMIAIPITGIFNWIYLLCFTKKSFFLTIHQSKLLNARTKNDNAKPVTEAHVQSQAVWKVAPVTSLKMLDKSCGKLCTCKCTQKGSCGKVDVCRSILPVTMQGECLYPWTNQVPYQCYWYLALEEIMKV